MSDALHPLVNLLKTRIAIIDGAMGTTLRTYGMTEAHIRGDRFKTAPKDLLNNGDLFSLTQGVQPARTTVEAAPPRKGVNVEIDAVAWVP